jgi:hypothetical protein
LSEAAHETLIFVRIFNTSSFYLFLGNFFGFQLMSGDDLIDLSTILVVLFDLNLFGFPLPLQLFFFSQSFFDPFLLCLFIMRVSGKLSHWDVE